MVAANARELGRTPLATRSLAPGRYALTLTHPGYRSWSGAVVLQPGKEEVVSARLVGKPGTLQVVVQHRGKATWATIFVNGSRVGDRLALTQKLPPGKHVISIRREGYESMERQIEIDPGGKRRVAFAIRKK